MRLAIHHRTEYAYSGSVGLVLQRVRLWPNEGPGLRVLDWQVDVEGASPQARLRDAHGNRVALFARTGEARRIVFDVQGEVETSDGTGVLGTVDGPPLWLYRRQTALTTPSEAIRALADDIAGTDALDALHALSGSIRAAVAYEVGATGPTTTADEALRAGAGVCQDHAHLFVSAAREAGIPARYVSGYLKMNDRNEQEATHAWAEAWVEGLGWVGFDVSNGYSPDERYVRLAVGLDYRDAAPISGLVRSGDGERNETLHVALSVSERQMQQQQQ